MHEFAKYVIACEGIKILPKDKKAKVIQLNHDEEFGEKNVRIELQKFIRETYKLNNRLKDLLEIAGYIYAADRKVGRGNSDALEYHSWAREFEIYIKVRDIEFWNTNEIKELLNEALCFMTGDRSYTFHFRKAKADFPTSIFDNEKFEIECNNNLRVALFSGGLDSLAGIIESMETTDVDMCLVSHQSGQPGVVKTQKVIYNELKKLYPNRLYHYKFRCGLTKEQSKEETQRTRAFLYTSIAFALAKTNKHDKIYVYENGITSMNFAETQDQMNARASRTTHPKTLVLLERLFTKISGEKFEIINPFIFKTKTDVVVIIKENNKLDLIDSTVSCSRTRNHPPNFTHCGICSQCIDRVFACYAAGIEEYDDNGIYATRIVRDELEGAARKLVMDYYVTAQKYNNVHIDYFCREFINEILDIEEYIEGNDEEERMEKIYELCRSHAKNLERALKRINGIFDKPLKKIKKNTLSEIIYNLRQPSKTAEEGIEQDLISQKFEKEFKRRGVTKGKTIPRKILYEIAKDVGLNVPKNINDFGKGEPSYQEARQYASIHGYKTPRKRSIK